MRRATVLGAALLALAAHLEAQTADVGAARWSGSAALNWYFIPDDPDIGMLVGRADHGNLHLEGRWNYENLHAGSLFAGWTFTFGNTVEVAATPMAGVAVGSVYGAIPGLEASVTLGPVDWYAEGEYVLDLRNHDDSFFYLWSELGVTPVPPLRLGLTAQRLRIRQTPLEVDRGPFTTLTVGPVTLGGYLLNPWTDHWFVVGTVGAGF